MRYSAPTAHSPFRIGKFLIIALAAAVFAAPGSLSAQFDSGESAPPPAPKPRFPQLPDDTVVPEPGTPAPPADRTANASELVGHIQKIAGRKITLKHNQTNKTHTVAVAPKAEIVLNNEAVQLEDLQEQDFVRVTLTQTKPDLIGNRVVAARVVNTPPQNPPPRTRTRVTEPREPRRIGNEAGLGVTVGDSPSLGILVLDVHQDTPAWTAGIQVGDYLLQLDRKELESPADLMNELARHEPQEKVRVVLWRRGRNKEGFVTLTTAQAAKDREATDGRALILAETHGDDTVVIKRAPDSVFLDREPEQSTVVLDKEPAGDKIVVERKESGEVPKDYDKLAEDYRRLQKRMSELEQELNRLKKQPSE